LLQLNHVRLGAVALLVSVTAGAQTRSGVSFEQTITSVKSTPGSYDSTTNFLHAIVAGHDMRIETSNNTLYPAMGRFSPGSHAVVLMRDGGTEAVFINPDAKEYLAIRPLEMVDGFKKMLEGMGGSMTFDTSASRFTVDSVGAGPMIDGHQTVHYVMNTASKNTISMMGQTIVTEGASVMDVYAAPDMVDFRDATDGIMSQFADAVRSMGMGGAMFDRMKESQRKVHGFPLRMVQKGTMTQRGQTRTHTETIESRNAKRVSVPDSLFAIPAGYKSIAAPSFPAAAGTGP